MREVTVPLDTLSWLVSQAEEMVRHEHQYDDDNESTRSSPTRMTSSTPSSTGTSTAGTRTGRTSTTRTMRSG